MGKVERQRLGSLGVGAHDQAVTLPHGQKEKANVHIHQRVRREQDRPPAHSSILFLWLEFLGAYLSSFGTDNWVERKLALCKRFLVIIRDSIEGEDKRSFLFKLLN